MKKTKPLPLPRSWTRPQWSGENATDRDVAIQGRQEKLATKAGLKSYLFRCGWSQESIAPVLANKYQAKDRLTQIQVKGHNLSSAVDSLRGIGLEVSQTEGPSHGSVLWDSLVVNPWWLTAGHEALVIVATASLIAEKVSAALVYDVWSTTGERPRTRHPVVRRVNLLTWSSAEALGRFSDLGKKTDIMVVTGGLHDVHSVHSSFGYLSAMFSQFQGLLVYEAVVPDGDMDQGQVANAAKRAGFHNVFGVSSGR